MVLGRSPASVLVKLPVPMPSVVLLLETVGFGLVFQHTPRKVTESPPSELIEPPLTAAFCVIEVIVAVVSTGRSASVFSDPVFLQENKVNEKRTLVTQEVSISN